MIHGWGGKRRWALTPLGRIRCLRWSVIDVWSGLKLPLSDDPRLIVWLTSSNSSAQKRAGLEMLFHPDGSAELRTGVLNQLSPFFFSLVLLESRSYQTVTGSSSYSGTLRKHSIISGTMFFKTIQAWEINWWQSWWVPVKVAVCVCPGVSDVCMLLRHREIYDLHEGKQHGDCEMSPVGSNPCASVGFHNHF